MKYIVTKKVEMSVKKGVLAVLKEFISQLEDCTKDEDFAEIAEIFEMAEIFDIEELEDDDIDAFYNSDTFSEYCNKVSVKLINKLNNVLEELVIEADTD